MLTMQDLEDSGHPFPRQRALDYANGYLTGREAYCPGGWSRADILASARNSARHPSRAFAAGYARACLDWEAVANISPARCALHDLGVR